LYYIFSRGKLPIVEANLENLEGFGHPVYNFQKSKVEIVKWPQTGWRPILEGTGAQGGVVEGSFEMRWRGDYIETYNHAVKKGYITGLSCDPIKASFNTISTFVPDWVYVFEANYHPDGGQIFFPHNNQPFIALLARPTDDIRPEHFYAFYFSGEFGIHIDPGVWHQPVYPLQVKSSFDDKQGKVHACVVCNFVEEFGVYLKVPLRI